MPAINVSNDTYARLQAFQPIVKWLQGKAIPLELSAEVLIHAGMRSLLDILWQQQDVQTLVESLQKLATRHPEEIYGFVAEVLKTGTKIEQKRLKDELRNRTRPFGFAAFRKKSD